MIVEAIAAGATACFLGSLAFARWCVQRADRLDGHGQPESSPDRRRKQLRKMRQCADKDYRAAGSGSRAEELARERRDRIDTELAAIDAEEIRSIKGQT